MTSSAPPSTLLDFHEDILLSILSYVADVPFELVESGELFQTSDVSRSFFVDIFLSRRVKPCAIYSS